MNIAGIFIRSKNRRIIGMWHAVCTLYMHTCCTHKYSTWGASWGSSLVLSLWWCQCTWSCSFQNTYVRRVHNTNKCLSNPRGLFSTHMHGFMSKICQVLGKKSSMCSPPPPPPPLPQFNFLNAALSHLSLLYIRICMYLSHKQLNGYFGWFVGKPLQIYKINGQSQTWLFDKN